MSDTNADGLEDIIRRVLAADTWNAVLGIGPGAPMTTIKKQYKALCKRLHPDKAGNNNVRASAAFVKVSEAYNGKMGENRVSQIDISTFSRAASYPYANDLVVAWKSSPTGPIRARRLGPKCKKHRSKFLPCRLCEEFANPTPKTPSPPPHSGQATKVDETEMFAF